MGLRYRTRYLDGVAGLLIINMILGHCIQLTDTRYIVLYSYINVLGFFMPWFFFKSGMFYREKETIALFHNGINKFLKPFLIWNAIGYIPFCISKVMNNDFVWYHYLLQPFKSFLRDGQYTGNQPLWFLIVFMFVQIAFNYIHRFRYSEYIIVFIGFFVGYIAYKFHFFYPRYVISFFPGIAFYALGYIFRNIHNNEYVGLISMIVYFSFCMFGISFVDINCNSLKCGCYELWPLCALAGILSVNWLFSRIYKLIKFKMLEHIGVNSMFYYVCHWVVVFSVVLFFRYVLNIESVLLLVSTCLTCVLILPSLFLLLRRNS